MAYVRIPDRIERALPARILAECCVLMLQEPIEDGGKVCRLLEQSFRSIVVEQFKGLSADDAEKAERRIRRAVDVVRRTMNRDCSHPHVGHAMMICRIIVQRVWNAGCFEPCEFFLSVWDLMVNETYKVTDNGRCLNASEAEAVVMAEKIIGILHREHGLWRGLERNEKLIAAEQRRAA